MSMADSQAPSPPRMSYAYSSSSRPRTWRAHDRRPGRVVVALAVLGVLQRPSAPRPHLAVGSRMAVGVAGGRRVGHRTPPRMVGAPLPLDLSADAVHLRVALHDPVDRPVRLGTTDFRSQGT